MISAGIDIGSISAKAVVLEHDKILGSSVIPTGYNAGRAGVEVFDQVLSKIGIPSSRVNKIVATGYGRNSVASADKTVTEISCHAMGAVFLNPDVRSIIDIGGQDSKAILIDGKGKVLDFTMNDKCAAGTGRFLEVMARALEVDLEEFGSLSLKADTILPISSLCTVFAESEVITLIARGEKRENIIAGIHASIGARVSAMGKRVGGKAPFMMTGGVAKNKGVVHELEKRFDTKIAVSEYAQINGALGAALIAAAILD